MGKLIRLNDYRGKQPARPGGQVTELEIRLDRFMREVVDLRSDLVELQEKYMKIICLLSSSSPDA